MPISRDCNKAVILARGLGTRMRRPESGIALSPEQSAVAETGLKAMIPIGRPFLDYVLSGLADAGYQEICLVIGPEHRTVREYYAALALQRFRLSFAIQTEPRGTADAVLSALEFVNDDDFVVMNSDNFYPVSILTSLRTMGQAGTVLFDEPALIRNSNIPADRIRSYAYGKTDSENFLIDLVEKPDPNRARQLSGSSLISMNCWRLDARIFEFCRNVRLSPRGEYELPNAIRDAVHAGMRLKVVRSEEGVLDLSHRSDIAAVSERLKNVSVSL
jgi:dTDP-glucose pyrophosphorylase